MKRSTYGPEDSDSGGAPVIQSPFAKGSQAKYESLRFAHGNDIILASKIFDREVWPSNMENPPSRFGKKVLSLDFLFGDEHLREAILSQMLAGFR